MRVDAEAYLCSITVTKLIQCLLPYLHLLDTIARSLSSSSKNDLMRNIQMRAFQLDEREGDEQNGNKGIAIVYRYFQEFQMDLSSGNKLYS